jgi:archaeosine synthase beta-subunit
VSTAYPAASRDRDDWILARRPARNIRDPWRPYAFHVENERAESGEQVPVATVFLTNRECPWRCVMCDLWRDTLTEAVPAGAIPAQIAFALSRLGPARQVKLYNAGSFFDAHAIPVADHPSIAERVRGFDRVIVECHPALVGASAAAFHGMLGGKLEVAMGLETANPDVLEKLNKRVTLERFARAASVLRDSGIPMRAFVLVRPPFIADDEAMEWARRSIRFAFECGAGVVSLIPTRGGNGAMEALAADGLFTPPRVAMIEAVAEYGISAARDHVNRPRVFADLWDIETFSRCPRCVSARRLRLNEMNRTQTIPPRVLCNCEG